MFIPAAMIFDSTASAAENSAFTGSGGEGGLAGSMAWAAGGSGTAPVVVGSAGTAGEAEGAGAGAGTPAGRPLSTLTACGLVLEGPGTVISTDCSAAAPSRMPPAASTRRGSFGRSLWGTAEGVGVAALPIEPVTPNPAYLSRGLPPTLVLHFGSGTCRRGCSCRLCPAPMPMR